MKTYILTVAGAAILSALAASMAATGWQKYIRLVTGIVILCCIIGPAAKLLNIDFSEEFKTDLSAETDYGDINRELIISELKERLQGDIEARCLKNYGADVDADVEIELNADNEIEGVTRITLSGDTLSAAAKSELCRMYGVSAIYEK